VASNIFPTFIISSSSSLHGRNRLRQRCHNDDDNDNDGVVDDNNDDYDGENNNNINNNNGSVSKTTTSIIHSKMNCNSKCSSNEDDGDDNNHDDDDDDGRPKDIAICHSKDLSSSTSHFFPNDTSNNKQPLKLLPARAPPIFPLWTRFTEDWIHANIIKVIIFLSRVSSKNPYWTITAVVTISLALAVIGCATNLVIVFDHEDIFTPANSLPYQHGNWIYQHGGFEDSSDVTLIIHSDGTNILHKDAMRRTFVALDTLRDTPGYKELCATSSYLNLRNKNDCWIWSTTQFWNHNLTKFENEVTTDEDLIRILSQEEFADGTPVYREASFGKYKNSTTEYYYYNEEKGRNQTLDLLTYTPTFTVSVGLPDTLQGEYFQEVALERLKELKLSWALEDADTNPTGVKLEFFTVYAYLLEYERALMNDMPLVPLTFYVMLLFTCVVFHRLGLASGKSPNGREPSRFSLGILSTLTIGLSLMSGYGLMFCVGIPFTNLAQMIPFIILGVGLDDTFIITGAYFRKLAEENALESCGVGDGNEDDDSERDENALITQRIEEVMEEVGLSIALTTTTTTFAFCLGCFSTIPGIQWVCLYASATISIDFIYQITIFVAFLTLDERRIIASRRRAKEEGRYLYIANIYAEFRSHRPGCENLQIDDPKQKLFTQRMMRWYANQLMRPSIKVLVLVVFSGLLALCAYKTTQLEQKFDVADYVPADSYTKEFFPVCKFK